MNQNVVLVDIMEDIVNSMSVSGISNINYQPGTSSQVVKTLNELDNSVSFKGLKYPLIAMVLPVPEKRGRVGAGFGYALAKIPRIVIATISKYPTDDVMPRYASDGVFKTVLYPLYYELLTKICQSKNICDTDPDALEHTKLDCPNVRRLSSMSTDWVDYIEILGLQLTLNQIKTC